MRVTENTNYETIREGLHRSKDRLDNLQLQSATLRKLNHPSDDPVGSAKVLELRTEKENYEQFLRNGQIARSFLDSTDHALGDLSDMIMRCKEIAINQASSPNSSEEARLSVSEELGQLFQQAVAVANRKLGDRFLFGGYKTLRPPVDSEGVYHGDDGQQMIEIANEVFISMNIPGSEGFNTQPKPSNYSQGTPPSEKEDAHTDLENVNLFEAIRKIRIAVLAGDIGNVRNALDDFDRLQSKMISLRAKVGARIQGLQITERSLERHGLTNSALSSTIEDADMVQVVNDMGKEETVFKSALASSRRLIQPTLLDFLK